MAYIYHIDLVASNTLDRRQFVIQLLCRAHWFNVCLWDQRLHVREPGSFNALGIWFSGNLRGIPLRVWCPLSGCCCIPRAPLRKVVVGLWHWQGIEKRSIQETASVTLTAFPKLSIYIYIWLTGTTSQMTRSPTLRSARRNSKCMRISRTISWFGH